MNPKNPEFVISRTFDAPRSEMWKLWTQPELMAKWWGPKGGKVGKYKMDFRPGGTYHYSMSYGPTGTMWGKMGYREIVVPEKLVYINSFSDEKGGLTRHPLVENWPLQLLTTITFEEAKGKTKVTITWVPFESTDIEIKAFADALPSMQQGWGGTLDQLGEYLAKAA